MRMYLPRRETPVIVAPFSLRLKRAADMGETSFGRRISLARMRRPVTTGRRARTTCSTSGSSGTPESVSSVAIQSQRSAGQSQSSRQKALYYLKAKPGARRLRLEHPKQQQNQHDYENQAESAAWPVAPIPTVRPCGNRAKEQNNQNDQQNQSHNLVLLFAFETP